MGELIDLILSNPLLIILIIGGLFSLLKRKTEQPESENEPSRRPMPAERRTPNERERARPSDRQTKPAEPAKEMVETLTIEEQHQQQLDELKERLVVDQRRSSNQTERESYVTRRRQRNNSVSKNENQTFKQRFKENVTPSGLINSVIMSEVIGPPRSMKPYESRPFKRKHHR